ncbi:ATPase [Bacteroidales bacterium]|nr:ATPase [Bacteroidales bacterium]
MNTPFVFGKIARSENFTDREDETALLVSNFKSLINTIIISPRRWGKSSLVSKAIDIATEQDKNLKICTIDLFNVRNEEHFYELLAHNILKVTSSKWEESVESAKKFFSYLIPKIIIAGELRNEISLDFDWNEIKKKPDEILDLAEKIAIDKGIKIVVCVDEFQNISEFNNPQYFQKQLRAHWQQHQNVSYCLYGSKRHMMLDVFTNTSMPFYKFGDLLFLEKIDTPSWISFIIERFDATNKLISQKQAELIIRLSDNHPYYVQQLSQQAWLRTSKECSEEIIILAHTTIIDQLSLLFVTITESLNNNQINFLKAMVAGEVELSSAATIAKYRLTSSANVSRARKALLTKDILDNRANVISFQDPMYYYWLKNSYFI